MKWMIVTDSFGTDLGLWKERNGQPLTMHPTHSVAKGFADGQDGYLVALHRGLQAGVRQIGQEA